MRKWLLPILVLAFLLRVIGISSYPTGFNADEASFGYDAYSLLKTGRDQWGEAFPLTLRSFGDFKLPLYSYLAVPSVAIFGLNEFAVRLPNAIFGTLAVLATYLLTQELFSKRRISLPITHYPLPYLAALLLAISPWHVSLSRGAFEANLTTFFVPLGVWAFYKGLKAPRWMQVAAFSFGLNLFTYHSARLFTPLFVAVLAWLYRKKLHSEDSKALYSTLELYKFSILILVVFFGVAGYTIFSGAGARGADVAIFNPTGGWQAVSKRRYEAVLQGVPDELARAFSNKAVFVFDQFLSGYLTYFSPRALFSEGVAEWTYGMIPGRGVLYLIEIPFILAALWYLTRNISKLKPLQVLVVWLLIAPIPAALAKAPGFAGNRAAVMMPAVQVVSALGAVVLYEVIIKKWNGRWLRDKLLYGYIVILLISLIFFLEDYRYHAPRDWARNMQFGRREVVEFTESVADDYPGIVFSRSLSEPHIFVAFYAAWDPSDYQRQTEDWRRYEEEGLPFLDQLGKYRLGKYTFRSINYKNDKNGPALLVGRPGEFPQNVVPTKTIEYPNGEAALLIVDPTQKVFAESKE